MCLFFLGIAGRMSEVALHPWQPPEVTLHLPQAAERAHEPTANATGPIANTANVSEAIAACQAELERLGLSDRAAYLMGQTPASGGWVPCDSNEKMMYEVAAGLSGNGPVTPVTVHQAARSLSAADRVKLQQGLDRRDPHAIHQFTELVCKWNRGGGHEFVASEWTWVRAYTGLMGDGRMKAVPVGLDDPTESLWNDTFALDGRVVIGAPLAYLVCNASGTAVECPGTAPVQLPYPSAENPLYPAFPGLPREKLDALYAAVDQALAADRPVVLVVRGSQFDHDLDRWGTGYSVSQVGHDMTLAGFLRAMAERGISVVARVQDDPESDDVWNTLILSTPQLHHLAQNRTGEANATDTPTPAATEG
ncbi:MAG TPA: hypothetical protein VHA82_13490 [Ramlibacter sp.]|uniref:hypothetical protein n=1 Tax=Ramlibacter sp. TaxID=1917967 RepID=UPI002B5D08EE|nr:hypothetical protein [Ramlibacter sp.]HVZ44818.1 hypothetical protein [Ramlibacter sp.]